MSETAISRKILRNTLYNALGRFWHIGVSLLLTPYIIHRIGLERYGIWTLASVITGYFGLLDFGVSTSFIRFISEYHSKKQPEKLSALINTGFAFYFLFSAVVIAVGFLCIDPLFALFKIQSKLYYETSFVFLVAIFLFGVNSTFAVFAAAPNGVQRMDIANKVMIVMSVLYAGGTIFFIEKGFGLPGLMINYAIVVLATSAVHVMLAFRVLPGLRFNPLRLASAAMFRRLFLFGFRMQLSKLSSTVSNHADKLIIGAFLSVSMVSFYHVGSSVIQSLLLVTSLLVSALVPAFTEIEAKGGRDTLTRVYLKGTKYLSFVAVPSFILLSITATDVVGLWIGQPYPLSAAVIHILSLGFLVNLLSQVAIPLCVAVERPGFMAAGAIVTTALNIILAILFTKLFGFPAMTWGTTIAMCAGSIYFVYKLNRSLSIPQRQFFVIPIPFMFACAAAVAPALLLDAVVRHYHWYVFERPVLFTLILFKGILFSGGYLASVYLFRLLDRSDLAFLSPRLPMFSFMFKLFGSPAAAEKEFPHG